MSNEIMEPVVYRWQHAVSEADWDEVISICHGAALALYKHDWDLADDYSDLVRIARIRQEAAVEEAARKRERYQEAIWEIQP